MHEEIRDTLRQVEREFGCRVLYACESGSRAWGFASPDSDYDVRFLYVHPVDWYLRLEEAPDTVDAMLPGDLDLSGWELRKALRLFAGCNAPLNEWLGSPVVYAAVPDFHQAMQGLLPRYFKPRKAGFHYLGMARKALEANPLAQGIRSKKLFYVLRPLLALQWIASHRSMPPTAMDALLALGAAPDPVLETIRELRERKQALAEADPVQVPGPLADWIRATMETAPALAQALPVQGGRDMEALNRLMRTWVNAVGVSAVRSNQRPTLSWFDAPPPGTV